MKRALLAILLVSAFRGQGQVDQLSVLALYDSPSRAPGILIPFRARGALMTDGALTAAVVVISTGLAADCRTMLDPFYKNLFYLKCTAPSDVTVSVRVSNSSQLYDLTYGPIKVRYPASEVIIVAPPPPDPNVIAGRSLFISTCQRCHLSVKPVGYTVGAINTARSGIEEMQTDSAIQALTAHEVEQIAAYLESLR